MQIIDRLEIERQNHFVEQIRLDHRSQHRGIIQGSI